jgi:exodeoxyribonuclease VII small subunit
MTKKEKTYNEAISELQSSLEKIESGDLDVDVLTQEIQKAAELLKFCRDKLFKADTEIRKILENIN